MRLHRLTLRDVKGVRERTVELPERGVAVIEGPNEIGKSTLLDAFDALIAFKATSRAAGVRALQPVDRDVGPFVEAELTVGGQRVRYAKRWLRQPATTLHVLGPRPEQLTGDAAQQRMTTLVEQHLDRTLWDALRLTQSGDGTVAPLVSSSVLTQALDAAAGAQHHAEGADAVLEQVAAERALYFTATGRPTGEYRAALTRCTEAQDALAEAHRRLEEAGALLERQEQARRQVEQAGALAERAEDELAAADEAGARAESLAAEHRALTERLAHAEEQHSAAVRAARARERLAAEERTLAAALEQAQSARDADLAAADDLRQGLLAAEETHSDALDRVERATDAVDRARALLDRVADERELAERESLLARATELVEQVRVARESQPDRPVERRTARAVRALQDRLDAMVQQHVSGSPSLEVEALGATVEVDLADDGGHRSVAEGQRQELSLAQETTVEVPGVARLRIRLPQEALGRVIEINGLRDELTAALDDLGVAHVDEVDALADATEQARTALREATRDVESLLSPHGRALAAEAARGEVPAELAERVDRARARLSPSPGPLLPEGGAVGTGGATDGVDESTARAAVTAADRDLRAARAAQREAAQGLASRRQEVAGLTTRLDRAEGRIAADTARLEQLAEQLAHARAEADDEVLAARVTDRAARATEAAQAERAAARAVAEADVAGVLAAVQSARHRCRLATRAREDALAELHQLKGQVEMTAGEGRQELYQLAEADLEDATRELRAVDRRARAARHLYTVLHRHRDEAHRAYVRPYSEALEALGRRVYGPDFGVVVDEDLALSARTLDGATVPFAELSGGAKEQLGILARLAVARLVDPTQGVPVVIDDALGYSDPDRLRRMGEVLGSTTDGPEDLQVILLTCTPDRYAAIPHVQTIRLSA